MIFRVRRARESVKCPLSPSLSHRQNVWVRDYLSSAAVQHPVLRLPTSARIAFSQLPLSRAEQVSPNSRCRSAMPPPATPATIQVHVQFPLDFDTAKEEEYLHPNNWRWLPFLQFPIQTLGNLQFAVKPYKWVRYATGITVGAVGGLSFDRNELNLIDYDAELPLDGLCLFYHVDNAEKLLMCPADPGLLRAHASGVTSYRDSNFRKEVIKRDCSCVVTKEAFQLCDAAHVVPFAKGDKYLKRFYEQRVRKIDLNTDDPLTDINDVRNGLLLSKVAHAMFGVFSAFLMLPNFALDTPDVVPGALTGQRKCVMHVFDEDIRKGLVGSKHGEEARMPASELDWPPDALFEGTYAALIHKVFGVKDVQEINDWAASLHQGGFVTFNQAEVERQHKEPEDRAERIQNQESDRDTIQHKRRHSTQQDTVELDDLDMVMLMPYRFMPLAKARAMLFGGSGEAEKEQEHKEAVEKVLAWQERL
ncbi:hypothetical protein BC835DRAFT_1380643 [Cytidiella melzeri]|nr:hypothetical protein BC835DRAFT_1380643 [Cytidiella melzeri]